jgi:putative component of toxin-antitoxin plasmid stabilization module
VPPIRLVFYREDDGTVPLVAWLSSIPDKAADKCIGRLRRLAAMGYELRRPEAGLLRDGIYEMRVGFQGINYRMLYFFHRNLAVVVSHGLIKERAVPPIEIERAIQRKSLFSARPETHSAEGS